MSGPIVRKYGFPNFEQIFGEREIQHGADDDKKAEETGTGLPPDLDRPRDPGASSARGTPGTIEPSTEFGATVE
jgi:hypothetical protein